MTTRGDIKRGRNLSKRYLDGEGRSACRGERMPRGEGVCCCRKSKKGRESFRSV